MIVRTTNHSSRTLEVGDISIEKSAYMYVDSEIYSGIFLILEVEKELSYLYFRKKCLRFQRQTSFQRWYGTNVEYIMRARGEKDAF